MERKITALVLIKAWKPGTQSQPADRSPLVEGFCVLDDQSPCWNMAWSAPEDWSRWDPEKLLVCPYDEVHRIKAKRFQKHLLKCRENHPEKDFVTCPFNAKHVMLRSEIRHHVSRCPDRVSRSQMVCYEHLLCELFRQEKVSPVFILFPIFILKCGLHDIPIAQLLFRLCCYTKLSLPLTVFHYLISFSVSWNPVKMVTTRS